MFQVWLLQFFFWSNTFLHFYSIKTVKVCLEKDPKLVQDKQIELNLIS